MPGGPGAKNACSQCRGTGLILGLGTEVPWGMAKKFKKTAKNLNRKKCRWKLLKGFKQGSDGIVFNF